MAALHTVHGRDTREARAQRSEASARLSRLEDAAYLLGMMSGPRSRGRKASGYVPVTTLEDVRQMVVDDLLHSVGGSVEPVEKIVRKTHRP